MQITMIRDKGAFKKGETYDLKSEKATELLTHGYCVRTPASSHKTTKKSKEKK